LAEVIRRYGKELSSVVTRLLGACCDDVDAAVDAALVRVLVSLPNYRGRVRLRIWLLRKAVTVVTMQRKVFRAGAASCESDALERLMTCLSEDSRTTFLLRELVGLATEDVAQILDTTLVATKARLYFARRKLIAAIDSEQLPSPLLQRAMPPSRARASRAVQFRAGDEASHNE
jgi:DNA-directed RNA polymerase specialized sigma24 family protein